MRRAVFLDRDGTLNESTVDGGGVPRPPVGVEDLVLVPGATAACRELKDLGFLVIVATNQPDVARGTQRRDVVEAIHRRIRQTVELDDVLVCYHDDVDGCECRKPKPGLLLAAAIHREIDLSSSIMIGDRWRDIEAGRRAGCTTILVGDGRSENVPVEPTVAVPSLIAAVHWIRETSASARMTDR
ncbi:MAG: HAD family hydrolase [Chloroflexota bacterium]|nr:HAD family hydrolase [Chloroflexota bacterium]